MFIPFAVHASFTTVPRRASYKLVNWRVLQSFERLSSAEFRLLIQSEKMKIVQFPKSRFFLNIFPKLKLILILFYHHIPNNFPQFLASTELEFNDY